MYTECELNQDYNLGNQDATIMIVHYISKVRMGLLVSEYVFINIAEFQQQYAFKIRFIYCYFNFQGFLSDNSMFI